MSGTIKLLKCPNGCPQMYDEDEADVVSYERQACTECGFWLVQEGTSVDVGDLVDPDDEEGPGT